MTKPNKRWGRFWGMEKTETLTFRMTPMGREMLDQICYKRRMTATDVLSEFIAREYRRVHGYSEWQR